MTRNSLNVGPSFNGTCQFSSIRTFLCTVHKAFSKTLHVSILFINYTIRMCYTIKCFQLLPDTCFSKASPWRGLYFIIDSSYINLPYYLCICHLSAWNHPPLYQLHTQNYQVFLRPGSASKMINKNIKLSKNVRKKSGSQILSSD